MRNKAKDEAEKAVRMERAMETGFRLFAEKGIDAVTMPEIADASGVTRPSLYRYFSTKPELVIAISTWKWQQYIEAERERFPAEMRERMTAREYVETYLDVFLDMYRNHRELLRFNHYFNSYIDKEQVTPEQMRPYREMIEDLVTRFHASFARSGDGTLRPGIPEKTVVSTVIHIMLAAVTRYAVGLAYVMPGTNPEDELVLLRNALLRELTAPAGGGGGQIARATAVTGNVR